MWSEHIFEAGGHIFGRMQLAVSFFVCLFLNIYMLFCIIVSQKSAYVWSILQRGERAGFQLLKSLISVYRGYVCNVLALKSCCHPAEV